MQPFEHFFLLAAFRHANGCKERTQQTPSGYDVEREAGFKSVTQDIACPELAD